MIFNLSAKSITLLLAVGSVATTTTAAVGNGNLRQGRRRATLFHSHESSATKTSSSLRAASPTNVEAAVPSVDEAAVPSVDVASTNSVSVDAEVPSITMNKSIYTEDESITITFSVGSPTHPYYSSNEAPSQSVDYNYPKYSIGLFMRDADPQGGTLSPIVSINVCGALGTSCDVHDMNYGSYNDVSVTFGSLEGSLELVQGQWPLEVSQYGTGFDAYVLDGDGAAAIGPLEFYISNEDVENDEVDAMHDHVASGAVQYKPSASHVDTKTSSSSSNTEKRNPLAKFNKGTKKSTERQHAATSAASQNTKIMHSNGLEMASAAIPSDPSIHKIAIEEQEEGASVPVGSITSNKAEYEYDDEVSIDFSLPTDVNVSNYKIGIFMRMAHPQGGTLDPIVSLPCSSSGSVTFSSETMEQMTGSQWPMNLYEWGTGFDAYILNENGEDVTGPVKFNIMMDDTY